MLIASTGSFYIFIKKYCSLSSLYNLAVDRYILLWFESCLDIKIADVRNVFLLVTSMVKYWWLVTNKINIINLYQLLSHWGIAHHPLRLKYIFLVFIPLKTLSGVIEHIKLLLIDSSVYAEEVEPTGVVPMEVSLER